MTDPTPNDLSNLVFEEFIGLRPQGKHAPGSEPLSPAAQAVLDAVVSRPSFATRKRAAAAIRAAAHHLQRCSPWSNDDPGSIPVDWCTSELHDIAGELEAL